MSISVIVLIRLPHVVVLACNYIMDRFIYASNDCILCPFITNTLFWHKRSTLQLVPGPHREAFKTKNVPNCGKSP